MDKDEKLRFAREMKDLASKAKTIAERMQSDAREDNPSLRLARNLMSYMQDMLDDRLETYVRCLEKAKGSERLKDWCLAHPDLAWDIIDSLGDAARDRVCFDMMFKLASMLEDDGVVVDDRIVPPEAM